MVCVQLLRCSQILPLIMVCVCAAIEVPSNPSLDYGVCAAIEVLMEVWFQDIKDSC